MQPKGNQDLESIIDEGRVSGLQIVIFLLCGLVAMVDGFDTQAIAFVAPEIMAAWGAAPSAFGPVFGAGLLGGLLGALTFGAAGDRFGRKTTLSCAVLLFALASLVTPLAHSTAVLAALRCVTGLGLGGALPSFISLTSEYAPKRLRSTLVGAMFCGFPLGAVLGGGASAVLIPALGWKSVFIVGGMLPLLILPVFMLVVPESARYLALRNDRQALVRILQRLEAEPLWNGESDYRAAMPHSPVSSLLKEGRAPATFLLWIAFFMSLLLTYFLINWIPVVARANGLDIQKAVLAVAMLNLGAVVGCVVLGSLADRFGPTLTISSAYLIGAIGIAAIGWVGWSSGLMYVISFVAGAFSIGAQMCTVALCAVFYETGIRATGIGWAMGIGRTGAIAGPVMGGVLLGAGVTPPLLFAIAGATSAGAALAVLALGYLMRRRDSNEPSQARVHPNMQVTTVAQGPLKRVSSDHDFNH